MSPEQELTYSNIDDENLLEPLAKALFCLECGSDCIVGLSIHEPSRELSSDFICVAATLHLIKHPEIIGSAEDMTSYM